MHTAHEDLHERDFHAWTRRQAKELRRWAAARPNLDLDLARISEEIADLGREQRNSLRSWVTRVIKHLLLLEHSPATAPRRHSTREMINFRAEIQARLTRTPRADLARQQLVTAMERFGEAEVARRQAATCSCTLAQVIGNW